MDDLVAWLAQNPDLARRRASGPSSLTRVETCGDKSGACPGGNALQWGLRGANKSPPNEDKHKAQYISLKAKKGKHKTRKLQIWHTTRKQNNKELSMYRLRQMEINDKVCEQVSMTMLQEVYPKAVIERCVQQSEPWSSKARRVRASTALALVLFVIGMALWSRLNQCQVWHKLVGKLSDLHPAEPESAMSDP